MATGRGKVRPINDATVKEVNNLYELLERIQKDQKETREKVGRDEKDLKDEDVKLLAAATKVVRGMKKLKLVILTEIANGIPDDDAK